MENLNYMSLEICSACVEQEKTLYKCSKCSASLCLHHYRSHKCGDPNLGLRVEWSARRDAEITLESWTNELKSKENKYEIEIRDDLTFIVEFPWFPFTKLKGFIPTQRSNYPFESSGNLQLSLYLEGDTQKIPEQTGYRRRYEHENWVRYQYNSYIKKWGESNTYFSSPNNQRTTKFQLLIPQFFEEDLNSLEKQGISVKIDEKLKNSIIDNIKTISLEEFIIKVTPDKKNDELVIQWSKKVDKWYRDLILIFIDYLTIIYFETDSQNEILESYYQTDHREIRVPYWAMFRAMEFWERLQEILDTQDIVPIKLEFTRYVPKKVLWKELDSIAEKKFELRFYQQEALDLWKNRHFFGSEQLPTGAGKTIIGIGAMWDTKERTLILVPNLDLVEQWKDRIRTFLGVPDKEIGIFSGTKKEFKKDIVISTYQLLSQYIQDYKIGTSKKIKDNNDDSIQIKARRSISVVSKAVNYFRNNFGLLIADECHHVQATTFKEIALGLDIPKRLALSATIEWELNTSLIISAMGPVIYTITYGTLSKEGFIPPIIYRKIKIKLTGEEKAKLGLKDGRSQSFRSKLCRNAYNKYPMIEKIIRAPFTKQILIFTSRISHAEEIHKYLKKKKIEATLLVGSVVHNTREREALLQKFRDKKTQILILVKMLNEGFDAPADTVIIVSGSKNKRDNIQRCGRTTRLGHVAKIFELIVDPDDVETEHEIALERDISNVIQPWIQDKLAEIADPIQLRQVEELIGSSAASSARRRTREELEITSTL